MKSTPALTAIALTVLALAASPIASADSTDTAFWQQLTTAGISVPGPTTLVGNEGREVCAQAQYGSTRMIVRGVVKLNHSTWSDSQADSFVTIAMKNYCPSL